MRKAFACLRTGATAFVGSRSTNNAAVYVRCDDDSAFIVALNFEDEPQAVTLDLERTLSKYEGDASIARAAGILRREFSSLSLEPYGALLRRIY